MTYLQAVFIALVQGVTELFPVSSLGHSVLLPAWIGGRWNTLVTQSAQGSSASSFYLAFIVALHVSTALALVWYFRADWIRIIGGLLSSLRRTVRERRFSAIGSDERLAWLIIVATIPVCLTGLALEHVFRTLFAKPLAAGIFLTINGLILLLAERTRRAAASRAPGHPRSAMPIAGGAPELELTASPTLAGRGGRTAEEIAGAHASDLRLSRLRLRDVLTIGVLQVSSLLAGISRDGITMTGGLWRGLDRQDAARFAFLLATPPILAAGLLKLPSLSGPATAHIHGQILAGFLVTGVTAYLAVRYLVRYFRTGRTLTPFGIYCLIAGVASIIRFS